MKVLKNWLLRLKKRQRKLSYDSITNLPVSVWDEINTNGNASLLGSKPFFTRAKKWNVFLFIAWENIYNEWLKKYQSNSNKKYMNQTKKICELLSKHLKGDRLALMKAKILIEQRIKPYTNVDYSLIDSIIAIESGLPTNFAIDIDTITVDKYYSYIGRLVQKSKV